MQKDIFFGLLIADKHENKWQRGWRVCSREVTTDSTIFSTYQYYPLVNSGIGQYVGQLAEYVDIF